MSKTLMLSPRLYYILVLFCILTSALLCDILFLDLLCIVGEHGGFKKLFKNAKKKK